MYSGNGYYYPPPNAVHDENSLAFVQNRQVYGGAQYSSSRLVYLGPPPQDLQYPQDFYPQSAYPVIPVPPPVPQYHPKTMKHSKHSARPMPQSLLDDPAFSTDPRAHPHFAMNSREEIVPADQSSYSDNSYRSRETSRGDPSFRRGLQATPGATYGHLPDHSEVIGGNSQNIRPTSEVSSYSYSSYPGSSQDPRASSGSIGLAYDDPHDDDAYNSSYASSSKSKLHTPKTPISSASAAFGPPTNLSQSPYAIFTPGGSPSSASSRSSSPLVPRTPSPHSGSPSTSTKKLKSSSSLHLHNPDEQEIEAPPAYTPLPTPVGLSFDIPTSAPAGASSSLLAPTPVPVPAPSTSADVLNTPTAFPTAPVRPPLATNTSAPELRPAPARDVPVRSATTPAKAPQPLPETIKMQRSRSRKTSISAPRDLDKIDELDETDPLGLAWHHESPYEAIQKAGVGRQSGPSGEPMRGVPKIFAAQNGVDPSQSQLENRKPSSYRKPVPVDPNVTNFHVKPGQLFPSIVPSSQTQSVPQQSQFQSPPFPIPYSQDSPPQFPQGFTNSHMHPASNRPAQPMPNYAQGPPPRSSPLVDQTQTRSVSDNARPSPSTHSSSGSVGHGHSPSQPPLRSQVSSASLARSRSAPNNRQPVLSSEPPPRPDIDLPPQRDPQSQQMPTFQPHYLPKRLVMPTPLQPLPQQSAPSNLSGQSANSSFIAPSYTGDPRDRLMEGQNDSGTSLKYSASVPTRAKAQDIPMSSGRNLLRKHKEKSENRKEEKRGGVSIAGITIIPGHAPSAKPDAAVFTSRVVMGESQRPVGRGGREAGLERIREKERERERDRDKEKEKGRKLSKRR